MRNYFLYNKNKEIVELYLDLIDKAIKNDITEKPYRDHLYTCSRDIRVLNTLRYYCSILNRSLYKFPNSFWNGGYSVERELICYLFLREYLVKDISSEYLTMKEFKKFRLSGMLSVRFSDDPIFLEVCLSKCSLSDLYVYDCHSEFRIDPYKETVNIYEYANDTTLKFLNGDLKKSDSFN